MTPTTPVKNTDSQIPPTIPSTPLKARTTAPRPTPAAIKLVTKGYLECFERLVTRDALRRWSKLLDCEDVAEIVTSVTFTMPHVPKSQGQQYYDMFAKILARMTSLRELKIRGSRSKQRADAIEVGVEQLMLALVQQKEVVSISKFELSATAVDHETLALFFEGQKDRLYYVDLENVLCCDGSWDSVLSTIRGASITVAHFTSLRASPHPGYAMFWGSQPPIRSVWNPAMKGYEYVLFDQTQAAMTGKEAVKKGLGMILEGSEWKKLG